MTYRNCNINKEIIIKINRYKNFELFFKECKKVSIILRPRDIIILETENLLEQLFLDKEIYELIIDETDNSYGTNKLKYIEIIIGEINELNIEYN